MWGRRSFCSHLGGKLSPTPILLPTFPSCEISALANRAALGPSVKTSAVLLFQFAYHQTPAQGTFLSPPVLSLKFPTNSHEYHTQQFPPSSTHTDTCMFNRLKTCSTLGQGSLWVSTHGPQSTSGFCWLNCLPHSSSFTEVLMASGLKGQDRAVIIVQCLF